MLSRVFEMARDFVKPPALAIFPQVESLEDRWCPTLHITAVAQVLPGHQVQVSGAVTGGPAAGLTVILTGGVNASTTTNAQGNYTYTSDDASLGLVFATGLGMDVAAANISDAAPDLSPLSISYSGENAVTISGTLTDLDAAGRTIFFSGVAKGLTNTDAQGRFEFTTTTYGSGMIQADTIDFWGQAAETETVQVSSIGPVILDFACHFEDGNAWVFTGRVNDEYPEGLTIRFGGLLEGYTTTVQADGTFSFTIILEPGSSGTVTAITTDWWGQDSEMEYCFVG